MDYQLGPESRAEFDYALALRFPGTIIKEPGLDRQGFFREVPAPVLGHELMHFMHLAGTATGFRSYVASLRLLNAQVLRIREDVASDGSLKLPVRLYRWIDPTASNRLPTEASLEVRTALVAHLYLDGLIPLLDVPPDGAPDSVSPFPGDLCAEAQQYASRFAFGTAREDPLVDTPWRRTLYTPGGNWEMCYSLGYRHLTEWAATTIERFQRRYVGERYDVMPYRPGLFSRSSYRDAVHHLTLPHGAVDDAVAAVAIGYGVEGEFGAETILALLDLALMLDPLIDGDLLLAPQRALDQPYSPWPTFLRVLLAAARHHADLPLLQENMRIAQIVEYQNSMLEMLGVTGNMLSLTETLAAAIDSIFDTLAPDVPEFPRDEHRETFRRVLQFRAERLDGGALFEDALTSKSKLQSFALAYAPAVEVGTVSMSGRRQSHGLDVDLQIANFAQMRDVICSFVTGDSECAAKGPPRSCAAPVHDLCDALAADDGAVRCLRAQTVGRLKRAVGAEKVIWSAYEAPRYRYV